MGRFEWTGAARTRSGLYHIVGSMPQVRMATFKVAQEVAARARANLAAQHHHIRIVPHTPFHIEVESAGGKYPLASWNVSLVGDNPMALEYGHEPSGHFAGTKTKAPAGTYVLHRAADLPGKSTARMGREFRESVGRGYNGARRN